MSPRQRGEELLKSRTSSKLELATKAQTALSSSVRTIEIRGRVNPFNASILSTRFGYLLAYRVSNSWIRSMDYSDEVIECCYLGDDFRQVSDSWPLTLGTGTDEDPRLVQVEDRVVLVYGGPANGPLNQDKRAVYLADLTLASKRVSVKEGSVVKLTHGTKQAVCEKNWTPFAHEGKLLLSYTVCPHEVVEITSGGMCQAVHITHVRTPWHGCVINGGTPAVRLSTDEYLAFFHTHENRGEGQWRASKFPLRHYFMGCYTFEAIPPFCILRCSAEPIVYRGIHSSSNPLIFKHKVVFPAGLIVQNGKVHVSCGENDACTKIISFELDELLASLVCTPRRSWLGVQVEKVRSVLHRHR